MRALRGGDLGTRGLKKTLAHTVPTYSRDQKNLYQIVSQSTRPVSALISMGIRDNWKSQETGDKFRVEAFSGASS